MDARWCLRNVHRDILRSYRDIIGFLRPRLFHNEIISFVKTVVALSTCTVGFIILVHSSLSSYRTNKYISRMRPDVQKLTFLPWPGCSLP
jgi:hypothetical protein